MFDDTDIISSYSRADALEDGTLVDVSEVAREAGFRVSVAVTRAVWEDCIAWDEADNTRKKTCQDQAGRLWDVVYMARVYGARNARADRVPFPLYRVPREGRGLRARQVVLHLHIGPGDAGEPVITIMEPNED